MSDSISDRFKKIEEGIVYFSRLNRTLSLLSNFRGTYSDIPEDKRVVIIAMKKYYDGLIRYIEDREAIMEDYEFDYINNILEDIRNVNWNRNIGTWYIYFKWKHYEFLFVYNNGIPKNPLYNYSDYFDVTGIRDIVSIIDRVLIWR